MQQKALFLMDTKGYYRQFIQVNNTELFIHLFTDKLYISQALQTQDWNEYGVNLLNGGVLVITVTHTRYCGLPHRLWGCVVKKHLLMYYCILMLMYTVIKEKTKSTVKTITSTFICKGDKKEEQ